MPQPYREPDFDDTICAHCGAKLPADPAEDTPAWDGYCSAACQHKEEVPCARPMFDLLRGELDRDWLSCYLRHRVQHH